MVLQRFLRRIGIDSRVSFGVRRDPDGALVGHAWLERGGRPYLEVENAGAYVATFSLPLADSASASTALDRARMI